MDARLHKLLNLLSKISYMRSKVFNNGYPHICDINSQIDMWDHWGYTEIKIKLLIIKEYGKED